MPAYRVSFFKHLLSSDGHLFKCLQQRVDVPDAESPARAREIGSHQFEKLHGSQPWKLFADSIEIEPEDRDD